MVTLAPPNQQLGPGRGSGRAGGQGGQSTVELAMLLPVLLVLLLVVVQVGLVVRDQLALHHAVARAARSAAVDPSDEPATTAAVGASSQLDRDRLTVELHGGRTGGDLLTVVVHYRSPTAVPIVGALVGDVGLRADAVVRVE